jgi:hypothetical protein
MNGATERGTSRLSATAHANDSRPGRIPRISADPTPDGFKSRPGPPSRPFTRLYCGARPPNALRSTLRTRTDRRTGTVDSVRHAAFKAGAALLYATALARAAAMFPGSSVVEQPAVNRLVAGSNPARGAK